MPYLVVKEMGAERVHPFETDEISIGRSRQNEIRLLAEQASRRHCRVVKRENRYRIVDGHSSNGTFLNGERIEDQTLTDGDAIAVGTAKIVFHLGEPPAERPAYSETATSQIPLNDRNVQLLLETVVKAASSEDLGMYLRTALDNIVEITQAERGILFEPGAGDGLTPTASRNGQKQDLERVEAISQTIPKQVFDSRNAIYLLDTESQQEAVESRSVTMYHLRTVMCAPLKVGDTMLGVLYVDSRAKAREYSATDLALFEGVAGYLSLTMANLRAASAAKVREEAQRRALERENAVLRSALEKRRHLVGECAEMKSVYENLKKVAPTEATVLVLGESGTGKEAIAHAIHDLSPRSEKPFVVIDCASIPETLLESELFGYEKGAFTGAAGQKPGKIEVADGGTVFLDEIAELPAALQAKLLRALEQKQVTRVGGVEPITVDVRLVAATNRDLEEMVKEGQFRQDLYFRLKVVSVNLPPLRERGDDILLLADHFLAEANAASDRAVKGFSDEAREALKAHRWEGNVRELKHRVEQAVILTNHEYLSTDDLTLSSETGMFRSLEDARDVFEKGFIIKALERHENNVTHTAEALGISRQHLQTLIKKHGIPRPGDPAA